MLELHDLDTVPLTPAQVLSAGEILVHASLPSLSPQRLEALHGLLAQPVDWELLFRLAQRHGLVATVYLNIQDCPGIPAPILARWHRAYQAQHFHNLHLTRVLLQINDLLGAAEIPVLCLKGPVLALQVYGDVALRSFCDLDIMVPSDQVEKTITVLLDHGYHNLSAPSSPPNLVMMESGDYYFANQDRTAFIDLHWSITPRYYDFPMDYEALWQRLHPLNLGSKQLQTLAPEDLLLTLCVHGTKDDWHQLKWVCDVAQFVRRYPDLNWPRLFAQAQDLHCHDALCLGLALAIRVLKDDLGPFIQEPLQHNPIVRLAAAKTWQRLMTDPPQAPRIAEILLLSWIRKSGYAIWRPTKLDRDIMPLPAFIASLYYPVRWGRLIYKYTIQRFLPSSSA